MNCFTEIPKKQDGKTISNSHITAFALSLQGASHISAAIPCQDYNDLRYLEREKLCVAAVADGVGSCKLSHWGAFVAVKSALDYLQEQITELAQGSPLKLEQQVKEVVKDLLFKALSKAEVEVKAFATAAKADSYAFQSTLTIAVFDGIKLLFGHVGDGGIVVQTQGGEVKMITERHKGEEVSSVCPLQGGHNNWSIGEALDPVVAFVLATDGVLDAFVAKRSDSFGINYHNGVCYSFIEEGIKKLSNCNENITPEIMAKYKNYMLSDAFRTVVQDDLTMIMVVAPGSIAKAKRPKFSKAIWDVIEKESNQDKRNHLWGNKDPNAELDACIDNVMRYTHNDSISAESPAKEHKLSVTLILCFILGLGLGYIINSQFISIDKDKEIKQLEIQVKELQIKLEAKNNTITKLKESLKTTESPNASVKPEAKSKDSFVVPEDTLKKVGTKKGE